MLLNAPKLLQHFLSGKADLTILAYTKDLEDFRLHVKAPTTEAAIVRLLGGTHPAGQALLAKYRATMLDRRGLGSATVNRRLSTLRSLGKESRILGMVPWVLEAKDVRHEFVRDTRGPSVADVVKLLKHMDALPPTRPALRDRALIRLMTDLALRRGTICRIDVKDFNPAQREVKVQDKGKRSKSVKTLTGPACQAIGKWLKARTPGSGPLFINFDQVHQSKTGKRITGSAIYAILKARGIEAGIKKPLHPHGLRHTAITMAAEIAAKMGYGLDKVAEFSGHSNVATLRRYIDKTRDVQGEIANAVSAGLRKRR